MDVLEPPNDTVEDPVALAAREYFGISYLFPYQRLVTSNILEAGGYFGEYQFPGGSDSFEPPDRISVTT